MADSRRALPAAESRYVVSALGALYVALAVGRVIAVLTADRPPGEALVDFLLLGGSGLLLLWGGFRLARAELPPDSHSRVVAWCLGGFAVMSVVVALLILNPSGSVDRPLRAGALATAIGSVGGFAIGLHDAEALARAREAERHERRLRRQNEQLERFADMVAHELRNPLNVAQLYLGSAVDGDDEAVEQVSDALGRMDEMISVLLVTARGSDAVVEAEPVAVAEAAAEAWRDVSSDDAALVVDTDREIRSDPVHLRHLFENLFSNAVEHASADDLTVRVGALPDGFYVEDDGSGIPECEREVVFDPGHTTHPNGDGLGLTVVARLADAHGWSYEATESESGGARFEFRDVDLVAAPGQ